MSAIHLLPTAFLERLQRIIPLERWDAVRNSFTQIKPTTFRVNTLTTTVPNVYAQLGEQGFRLERVPWYPAALILREGKLKDLQKTRIYTQGEIYVQGLASMLPPLALDPCPEETILDLTAAPGSKTTQMACLMKGQGKIIANDNNKIRYYRMKANVESQGALNVELSFRYGETFGREYPGRFDRVLLDAPCSAEGRFNLHNPKSFLYWKPLKIREMVRKQKKLIFSAVQALRTGGTLVYSTCTFAPEENEGILHWALEKFQDQLEIENISFPISNQMPGLSQWEKEPFHPWVRRALRILPTAQMEGFFIAKMRKMR